MCNESFESLSARSDTHGSRDFLFGVVVIGHLTLPERPCNDTRSAIRQLESDLRPLEHLAVPHSTDQMARTKIVSEVIRAHVGRPGDRTVVLLNDGDIPHATEVSASIAAHGPTTLVSVARDEHMVCSDLVKDHVAIRGGTPALLRHLTGTVYLSRTADVVVGYHDGTDTEFTNLKLAAHLLTENGLYMNMFDVPGVSGAISTLYTAHEVRDMAASIAPTSRPFVQRMRALLSEVRQRLARRPTKALA